MGEALPPRLSRVTVHGATIANLLASVVAGGAPCDGLLFGDTTHITSTHLQDNDDPVTRVESVASIASVLCCAAACSFYDGAGGLDESKLEELTKGQPPGALLGWLSYRPGAAAVSSAGAAAATPALPLRCSAREAAVAEALLARQLARGGGRQAALLLLVTSGADHNGATLTWQYRCFQARRPASPPASSDALLLEPVELATLNLAHHTGARDYQELAHAAPSAAAAASPGSTRVTHASAGWAAAPAATSASSSPPPPPSAIAAGAPAAAAQARPLLPGEDPELLAALAAGSRAQTAAVKRYCEALLGGLREAAEAAATGEAEVAALRRRRDALLAQLARA